MYTVNAILWNYVNGQLVSNQQVVYSPNTQDSRPVTAAQASLELGEAGSSDFTLVYGHPLYDQLVPLETYISILDGNEEIFYGRILKKSDPTFLGQITYVAEGALSFLKDSELPPFEKNAKGKVIPQTKTAEEMFRWCIEQHNAQVDARRQFTVGIVNADKKNEQKEYEVSSYTETLSGLTSEITGTYGGYFRVRSNDNGGHYIDWIQEYDTVNPQAIDLGVNVMELTHALTAENLFTVLRPVGKNGLLLDPPTIDLFSADKMAKMGRIVKSVSFSDAETVEALQTEANNYVSVHQNRILSEATIRLIDMHYLDNGTTPKIKIGDRFNNVYGASGTEFTVSHIDIDFLHVENETFTFKNRDELDGSNSNGVSGGALSKSYSGMAENSQKLYKLYTETKNQAAINADQIDLNADNINIVSIIASSALNGVNNIQGSAIYQNGDGIVEVAGQFRVKDDYYGDWGEFQDDGTGKSSKVYHVGDKVHLHGDTAIGYVCIKECPIGTPILIDGHVNATYWREDTGRKGVELVDGAAFEISDQNGSMTSVGAKISDFGERIDSQDRWLETFQGSALWTQRDNITGVCGEYDIVTDPTTGEKTLIIRAGGGMKIRKDNVEYGLYYTPNGESAVLTGGIMVNRINAVNWTSWRPQTNYVAGDRVNVDGVGYICQTPHKSGDTFDPSYWRAGAGTVIRGDMVSIEASQVRVGDVSTVAAWMAETGNDIDNLEGIVTTNVTALSGRIGTLEADHVTIGDLTNVHNWMDTTDDWKDSTDDTLENHYDLIAGKAAIGELAAAVARIGDLEVDHVTIGDLTNVHNWMDTTDDWKDSTDDTLENHYDLIAGKAAIGDLTALRARVSTIESDYITTDSLSSRSLYIYGVHTDNLVVDNMPSFGGVSCNVPGAIGSITLTDNQDGTYTLSATKLNRDTVDIGTFTDGWADAVACVGNSFSVVKSSHQVRLAVPSSTRGQATTKTTTATYSAGDWDGGTKRITFSVAGAEIYDGDVRIPSLPSGAVTLGNRYGTGDNYDCTVSIGDATRSSTIDVSAAHDNAWAEAVACVGSDFVITKSAHQIKLNVPSSTRGQTTSKTTTATYSAGNWTSGTKRITFSVAGAAIYDVDVSIPNLASGAITLGSRYGTSSNYNCSVAIGDTTKSGTIDLSAAYTDARSGYTEGTFTLASVTLQGSQQGVYEVVASGGVVRYEALSDVTLTEQGEAEEITPIGTKVTRYTAGNKITRYQAGSSRTITPIGTAQRITPIGASGTYYEAGSSVTRYKAGSSRTITPVGAAQNITPIGASETITPIGTAVTRYTAGTAKTLYKIGSYKSITPIGNAVTRYEAGTQVTLYPAKAAVTYYKGNGQRYSLATRYTRGSSHSAVGSYAGQINGKSVYYMGEQFYAVGNAESVLIVDTQGGSYYLRGDSVDIQEIGPGQNITPIGTAGTYYEAGTTESFVTLGDPEEVTPIGTAGTYYTAGTAKTLYNAGTQVTLYTAGTDITLTEQGEAETITKQGSAVTRYAAGTPVTLYPAGTAITLTEQGAAEEITPIGDAGQYYMAGSKITRYKAGTSRTIHQRGTNGIRQSSATVTRYRAGSTVSDTYYTKS